VKDPTLNRLVLLTASSADVPAYYLEVDAHLVSTAHNGYVLLPVIGPSEKAMAVDSGALVLSMIWAFALALTGIAGAVAAARWSAWPVYLVITPAVLAILWNLYQSLAALLPNLY
jgi:sortase A